MIDNSDKVGHWSISICASMAQVNSFQCPTLVDALQEVKKVTDERKAKRLPTRATARMITGKTQKGLTFGQEVVLI